MEIFYAKKREVQAPLRQNTDNPSGFRELFESHYPSVVRQLTFLTGERAVAEDLAQNLFLKLYTNPPQDLANPGGWLAKSAMRLATNYFRGEKRRHYREEYVGVREMPNVIAFDDIHLRNQEIRMVQRVLASLAERDRILLLLRFSGYRYEEIAPVIGVEKASVGTLLARALSRFRREYCRLYGGEPNVTG